jgi:hypothetical protein
VDPKKSVGGVERPVDEFLAIEEPSPRVVVWRKNPETVLMLGLTIFIGKHRQKISASIN